MPRLNQRRGLLEEVKLEEQNVAEAHMRPRERGQAYQEVVPWRSGFSWRKAELQCLVFPRHDAYRAEFRQALLEKKFQVLREDEGGRMSSSR